MFIYLSEGKADSPAVQRYRSRYFVLTKEGVLAYYENESEVSQPAKMKGAITMDGAVIHRFSKADTGQEHSFSIMPSRLLPEEFSKISDVIPSDTTRAVDHAFSLSAPNAQAKEDWLNLLEHEARGQLGLEFISPRQSKCVSFF